ncbi:reverse transcriptase-like protein [Neobacillus sp. YIM B06451]|uniref:reverse transcriptase-like protein n=1 Tax=Neobacillus sp. YIM B06451 TaxID=3070994 RepID=UPI00292FE0D8|nr:reverse transcriptase-like protein [Neobacillus sp. YIM B06451]
MKYKLEWVFTIKGGGKVRFYSDWLEGELALATAVELEKTGKAHELAFEDEIGTEWSMKEMRRLLEETEEEPHDVVIYFDGGFMKDTNEAGLGVVLFFKQGRKKFRVRANERIGEMETNNEAEYAALYFAATLLEEYGIKNIPCEIRGDSQGVLKQLEGEWPCYEEVLNRWLDRIEKKLESSGIKPSFKVISRSENKEADKLASQALDGKRIHAKTQLL